MAVARCCTLLIGFAAVATASWSKAEVADEDLHQDEEGYSLPPARSMQSAESLPAARPAPTPAGEKSLPRVEEHAEADPLLSEKDLIIERTRQKEEETWLTVLLVIIVITLSMLFEFCQSLLLKKLEGHPYMLMVINGLFKELTLLGFVALVSTTLVKTGIMVQLQEVADEIFCTRPHHHLNFHGEDELDEEEPLDIKEMFEEVHLLIFIIMVVFIFMVCFLLVTAYYTKKFFESAEGKKSRVLKEEVLQQSVYSPIGWVRRWRLVMKMQYRILRKEFFQPTSGPQSLPSAVRPATFKFSAYLGLCMAFNIVGMIEVPVSTWLTLMVVVVACHPLMGMAGEHLFVSMMLISIALFSLMLLQFFQAWRIFKMCLPEFTPSFMDPNPVGTKKERKKTTPKFYKLPPKRAHCPTIARWIYGTESPTKHEQCFIFWKNGPAFHTFLMRLNIFINAVFIGVYVKIVAKDPGLLLEHKLCTFGQWLPFFFGQVVVMPNLIFFTTIISSTGMFKMDNAMNLTIHQQLEEKYSRYFLLIYELNTLAQIKAIHHMMAEGRDIRAYSMKYARRYKEEMDEDEQRYIEEIFTLWDEEGNSNGMLDESEFTNFLQQSLHLPEHVSDHLARKWFRSGVLRVLPRDVDFQSVSSFKNHSRASETSSTGENNAAFRDVSRPSDFLMEEKTELLSVEGTELWTAEDSVPPEKVTIPCVLRRATRSFQYVTQTPDSITMSQFKMLYMIMREIEINGTTEENLNSWLVHEVISGDDDLIHVDDFENLPVLREVASFSGITERHDVVQLFNVIANPPDEDDVTEHIHIQDFTTWIRRMMEEQKTSSGQSILCRK